MDDSFEAKYWEDRYREKLGSGEGSRGDLLDFKAKFLNGIFADFGVESVFDFGCGDGYLANLLTCRRYFGVDISAEAVKQCRELVKKPDFVFEQGRFEDYKSCGIEKKLTERWGAKADAMLCIDVLYHIMDEELATHVLTVMFGSKPKVVVLYTIPNEKLVEKYTGGAIHHFNTETVLSKLTDGYRLAARTKPVGISGAGFFVWEREAI